MKPLTALRDVRLTGLHDAKCLLGLQHAIQLTWLGIGCARRVAFSTASTPWLSQLTALQPCLSSAAVRCSTLW